MRSEKQEEEDQEIEEVVHRENRKFQPERGKINLIKKRCTQMKTNRWVFMPPSRPIKEECILQTRNQVWVENWKAYKAQFCKDVKQTEESELQKRMITVYGDIQLSKEEKKGQTFH